MENPFSLPRSLQGAIHERAMPWRWLFPALLVLLFLAVLLWLPWQARQMETNERQEQLIADTLWVEQTLRFELARSEEALATLGADLVAKPLPPAALQARFDQMFKNGHELRRVLWLDEDGKVLARHGAELPASTPHPAGGETQEMARLTKAGRYTEPYGATPQTPAMLDYYLPLYRDGAYAGSLM